jgi:hypothetical protein
LSGFGIWVLLWVVAIGGMIAMRSHRGRREVGLVWAYVANLWLLHWPGAVIYMLPWYSRIEYSTVYAGFVQATIAIIGFCFGAAILSPILLDLVNPPGAKAAYHPPDALLPRTYIAIGVIAYLVIVPFAMRLPTISAVATASTQLVIVGICLRCWHGWHAKRSLMFYSSLALAGVMPFATVLGQGFLGYGAAAVMAVLCFNGSFIRPRWKVALCAVIVAYLGFSSYVTYMRDRNEIRRVVWGGESLTSRFTSVLGTVRETEWFDPYNPVHLQRIDLRLNQNYLVGASVEMLTAGAREFAKGETVLQAMVAIVPRALWPSKPVFAGSGDIVSTYTGISFAAGTSVGVGQVMEFYVNFGGIGVFVGFLILGALVAMFDAWAADKLWAGNWMHFAMFFLAGLGFIQAGGSLVEVISTVGAGMLAALLVNRHVIPALERRHDARFHPTTPPPVTRPYL